MDPVYTFLYDWVNEVLNVQESLGVIIFQSHQNAPEPETKDAFIVIGYAPSRNRIGRPHHSGIDGSDNQKIINDYVYTVELRERNGTGELLELLINSIYRRSVQEFWTNAGYSYMREISNIITIPTTQLNQWERESMVEIEILTGRVSEEQIGAIETVEVNGTIPAQGRSGEHTITSTINS